MARRWSALAVLGIGWLVACGGAATDGDDDGTRQATVVLQDDFSDASTGWLGGGESRFEGENTVQEIVDGVFRITVVTPEGRGGPDTTDLAVPGADALESLDDVVVEIDVTVVERADRGFYGVLCRMQDFDNFYGFAVVDGGAVSIFKIEEGITTELAGSATGLDVASAHHIQARCDGHQLSLAVDGAPVVRATDDTFGAGAVGLLAETRGAPGFTVEFDDLVVQAVQAA